MYASRNIELCSKDCLCLFVCPTGATDTETGQIDKNLCLDGCRLCVDACPSHAIYLVMDSYAVPAQKDSTSAELMLQLLESKASQEAAAAAVEYAADNSGGRKLAAALRRSMRILAEDCAREAGYMLPTSPDAKELLEELSGIPQGGTSQEIQSLIGRIK